MREPEATTASILQIKLDGTQISQEQLDRLEEMLVDQHAHLPGMFRLRFYDPDMKLIDDGPFNLVKEIEIAAYTETGTAYPLIRGEITALEPEFGEGMLSYLVVHGYDKSHRLYRETRSKAYLNKKDSDLASELGRKAGLSVAVDTTSTVYDHLFQHNQSDMEFLRQRAWRIGYECFVEDGKLYFRKPVPKGSGPSLQWGEDLISFMPRVTLAEQVDEVVVRGWDAEKQQPIIGKAARGQLYPQIGESKNGAAWAGAFGKGKLVIVDQPVVSQAEANKLAEARLDEVSGAFVEAEGVAFRRPDIRAGKTVELKGVGRRFSGTYLVTNATHSYTERGLKTTFRVRGTRTGSLAEQMTHQTPLDRWPGVVTAVVTNTDDPQNWGRVKVKFPWLDEDSESDWARVIGIGAGPQAGFHIVPEVGDEVAVVFEHGDFNRPFVIGGLWNGKHAVSGIAGGAKSGEKPLVRTWYSRTGHHISMYDDDEKKIEIVTAGGHAFTLSDKDKKIEIKSSNGHTLTMDDQGRKVVFKSGGDVQIESSMNMKIKSGAMLDIEASGVVSIKGATVKLN